MKLLYMICLLQSGGISATSSPAYTYITHRRDMYYKDVELFKTQAVVDRVCTCVIDLLLRIRTYANRE